MFNFGELKDILEIHKEIKVTDKNTGISGKDYKKLYRLRCKKKSITSKEYLSANRDTEMETVKFLIFSRRDIYLSNIVVYKNEKYDIKHINSYDNGYVELICEVKR